MVGSIGVVVLAVDSSSERWGSTSRVESSWVSGSDSNLAAGVVLVTECCTDVSSASR